MKLKEKGFEYAHFIHCYAHKLNLVLSRSAEKVSGVKIFFSHLRAFSKFTSSSSKRKSVFREFKIFIPSLSDTRWCYRSRTVSAIKEKRENLQSALQHILDDNERWDEDTLSEADNLLLLLNDFNFMFFVNSFYDILSQAGILFDILQCKKLDITYAKRKINMFMQYIESHQNDSHYGLIHNETSKDIGIDDSNIPPSRRTRRQIDHKTIYFEILKNMNISLKERFCNVNDFSYFELVDVLQFEAFSRSFPVQHLDVLQREYPGMFVCKSLMCELKYIYDDSDFRKCASINAILELLHQLGFLSVMPQTVKLIQLILTIPATSVANERSFSTLERIRSFLRSTMAQERLSSLARISIEKKILIDLEQEKDLHSRILDEFALKPRRLDFMFK